MCTLSIQPLLIYQQPTRNVLFYKIIHFMPRISNKPNRRFFYQVTSILRKIYFLSIQTIPILISNPLFVILILLLDIPAYAQS